MLLWTGDLEEKVLQTPMLDRAVSSLPGQFSFLHVCLASTINQDIIIKRHFYSGVEMVGSTGMVVPACIC